MPNPTNPKPLETKPPETKPPETKPPETILIIDDTPDNLRFLADLLNRAGYAVRKVISGELGLEAAQLVLPDLILLDIRMPGLDGYQVCDRLKANPSTRSIPIIFLSAMSEELDKVMAFEAGCVDYITKPFQVAEVLARIENQLQVSRLRQALEQQNAELQRSIAQCSLAETALETLHQDLDAKVQAALNQLMQQSLWLTPAALQTLQNALSRLSVAESLTSLVTASVAPSLQNALRQIAASADTVQQILEPILPNAAPLPAAELTQFCRDLVAQWPLDQQRHDLAVASWGSPAGRLPLNGADLQQVIAPVLDNALRYSPQGGSLLLQLTYVPSQVLIEIRDAGIGIPTAELDRICDQFYRASNAAAIPGQGLGLFVAQQIIAPTGGNLHVSSQLGVGTTVRITLPLTDRDAEIDQAAEPES
ncbi:MAG: response regulator [Pegethrix bostrychoides GSE-TBD4-15B]|uniref:histidine kinase n=1 Tax=Pegethrix bostrychoides GSE-TBD4-15B TaxID=2839662 RepID=A0A951PD20_9CYAN|nr:response regulator [Pegethrix bostrychoides GSE-TBD4-15B]